MGSLFNNGVEWQKLDQALTMIGNDIVRFCQLVLQLYVIFTKVVTLKVFQKKVSYKSMIAFMLLYFLSFRPNLFLYSCHYIPRFTFFEPTFCRPFFVFKDIFLENSVLMYSEHSKAVFFIMSRL